MLCCMIFNWLINFNSYVRSALPSDRYFCARCLVRKIIYHWSDPLFLTSQKYIYIYYIDRPRCSAERLYCIDRYICTYCTYFGPQLNNNNNKHLNTIDAFSHLSSEFCSILLCWEPGNTFKLFVFHLNISNKEQYVHRKSVKLS